MLKLFNVLVDICLLRRGPQALPASTTLTALALLVYGGLVAGAEARFGREEHAFAWAVASLALTMGAVYALLKIRGAPERFRQTVTALAGCGALYLAAYLPVTLSLSGPPDAAATGLTTLLSFAWLALFFWAFLIEGNIYRHALGISLPAGVLTSTLLYAAAAALYYGYFAEPA